MHMEQKFPTHNLMKVENQIQARHIFIDLKNIFVNTIFFSIKKMLRNA
jgi:hypothetical protein